MSTEPQPNRLMTQAAEALPSQPTEAGTFVNLALEQAQLYTGLSPEDFGRTLASIRHHAHQHGMCEMHFDFAQPDGAQLRSVTIMIEHQPDGPMDQLSIRSAESDVEALLRVHGISGFYYVIGTIHSIPDISSFSDPEVEGGQRYLVILALVLVAIALIGLIAVMLGGLFS